MAAIIGGVLGAVGSAIGTAASAVGSAAAATAGALGGTAGALGTIGTVGGLASTGISLANQLGGGGSGGATPTGAPTNTGYQPPPLFSEADDGSDGIMSGTTPGPPQVGGGIPRGVGILPSVSYEPSVNLGQGGGVTSSPDAWQSILGKMGDSAPHVAQAVLSAVPSILASTRKQPYSGGAASISTGQYQAPELMPMSYQAVAQQLLQRYAQRRAAGGWGGASGVL